MFSFLYSALRTHYQSRDFARGWDYSRHTEASSPAPRSLISLKIGAGTLALRAASCLLYVQSMSKPKSTRTKRSTTLTPYNVSWSALSDRERNLLHYLGTVPSADLSSMTRDVFGDLGTGTSPARNTLRRLKNCQLVARIGRGRYAITAAGRNIIPLSLVASAPAPLMDRAPLMTMAERLEHERTRQHSPAAASAVADILAAALRLIEAHAREPERETAPTSERRVDRRRSERRSN